MTDTDVEVYGPIYRVKCPMCRRMIKVVEDKLDEHLIADELTSLGMAVIKIFAMPSMPIPERCPLSWSELKKSSHLSLVP